MRPIKYRRTVSMSARAYVRLRRWAHQQGQPLAALIEGHMMQRLDDLGVDDVSQEEARELLASEYLDNSTMEVT